MIMERLEALMANHAFNVCERFFTGDAVADAISSTSPAHGLLDYLDCLRRYLTKLFLGGRERGAAPLSLKETGR